MLRTNVSFPQSLYLIHQYILLFLSPKYIFESTTSLHFHFSSKTPDLSKIAQIVFPLPLWPPLLTAARKIFLTLQRLLTAHRIKSKFLSKALQDPTEPNTCLPLLPHFPFSLSCSQGSGYKSSFQSPEQAKFAMPQGLCTCCFQCLVYSSPSLADSISLNIPSKRPFLIPYPSLSTTLPYFIFFTDSLLLLSLFPLESKL